MADHKKAPTENVCRNYLVLYSKKLKCSLLECPDMRSLRSSIPYGKAKVIAYYLLDEQDGITDVVFDLRDVHKKYIGKKGMSYRDFVLRMSGLVPESFALEGFSDASNEKILALACVVAGNDLHFYGPYYPWAYHTRAMLEGLDKFFGEHLVLDRYKDFDITRKLIEYYLLSEMIGMIASFLVCAGGVALMILGITRAMPLWLGLLLGIPLALFGGLFGIMILVDRLKDDVRKKFEKKQLDDSEFYHLATRSRIR